MAGGEEQVGTNRRWRTLGSYQPVDKPGCRAVEPRRQREPPAGFPVSSIISVTVLDRGSWRPAPGLWNCRPIRMMIGPSFNVERTEPMSGTSVVFAIGAWIISALLTVRGDKIRVGEEKNDERFSHEAEPHKLYWRVAHMRSDVSAITLLLAFVNGLIAAILGTLIVR
jgi:hypothetical protein